MKQTVLKLLLREEVEVAVQRLEVAVEGRGEEEGEEEVEVEGRLKKSQKRRRDPKRAVLEILHSTQKRKKRIEPAGSRKRMLYQCQIR